MASDEREDDFTDWDAEFRSPSVPSHVIRVKMVRENPPPSPTARESAEASEQLPEAKAIDWKQEAHDLLWNLGGCSTLALGYEIDTEFAPELTRPALRDVQALAKRERDLRAELATARASLEAARAQAEKDAREVAAVKEAFNDRVEVIGRQRAKLDTLESIIAEANMVGQQHGNAGSEFNAGWDRCRDRFRAILSRARASRREDA